MQIKPLFTFDFCNAKIIELKKRIFKNWHRFSILINRPSNLYDVTSTNEMLTNNGAADGIFFNGNQLYVKGERIWLANQRKEISCCPTQKRIYVLGFPVSHDRHRESYHDAQSGQRKARKKNSGQNGT